MITRKCGFVFLTALIVASAFVPVRAEEKKTNFAVVALKNGEGLSSGEVDIIADRLRTELFRTGKVNMMERDQMQEILKEQGFQQSGSCTDEACMVEMGQLLGVEKLVSGSIGKLGSMFLVNLRTIDVQTAKISKVVSVDVKGSIEDVVDQLPNIAYQLVGEVPATQVAIADNGKKVSPQEKKQVSVKTDTSVVQTPHEPQPASVIEGGAEKRERNVNRSGVKLCLGIYSGVVEHTIIRNVGPYSVYTDYDTTTFSINNSNATDAYGMPFLNPQVKFVIKAGPFLTVDIGPGFIFGRETYEVQNSYYLTNEITYRYFIPDVTAGLNFVLRIFPVKINVGATGDLLVPIVSEYQSAMDTTGYYLPDVHAGFAFVAGFRAGVEFLLNSHIGFGFDFAYRRNKFTLTYDVDDYSVSPYGNTVEVTHEFGIRPVILGASINIYY